MQMWSAVDAFMQIRANDTHLPTCEGLCKKATFATLKKNSRVTLRYHRNTDGAVLAAPLMLTRAFDEAATVSLIAALDNLKV